MGPAAAHHDNTPYVGDTDCPHGGNLASVACLLYLAPDSAYITETKFSQYTMTMPDYLVDAGNHILQGLWTYSGSPCTSFVEQVYVYGLDYHRYYEYALVRRYETPPPGQPSYQHYPDGVTSNSGEYVMFQTEYTSDTTWRMWRGASLRAQFSGGGLGYGSCIAQAGLEVSRYGSGVQSGYVSYTMNHDTYWYDQNRQGKGGWAQGTERRYQQYPCYLGQVPPNCLNGQWNSGVQWSANKP